MGFRKLLQSLVVYVGFSTNYKRFLSPLLHYHVMLDENVTHLDMRKWPDKITGWQSSIV